jgi:hypothetical protein
MSGFPASRQMYQETLRKLLEAWFPSDEAQREGSHRGCLWWVLLIVANLVLLLIDMVLPVDLDLFIGGYAFCVRAITSRHVLGMLSVAALAFVALLLTAQAMEVSSWDWASEFVSLALAAPVALVRARPRPTSWKLASWTWPPTEEAQAVTVREAIHRAAGNWVPQLPQEAAGPYSMLEWNARNEGKWADMLCADTFVIGLGAGVEAGLSKLSEMRSTPGLLNVAPRFDDSSAALLTVP